MLVLTRKLQETIQIGDEVTITILKVKGRTVRLGIEAPRQVRVVRGELPPMPAGEDRPVAAAASGRGNRSADPAGRRNAERHFATAGGRGRDAAAAADTNNGRVLRSPLAALVQQSIRVEPMSAAAH